LGSFILKNTAVLLHPGNPDPQTQVWIEQVCEHQGP
jgi:hypothetical protein